MAESAPRRARERGGLANVRPDVEGDPAMAPGEGAAGRGGGDPAVGSRAREERKLRAESAVVRLPDEAIGGSADVNHFHAGGGALKHLSRKELGTAEPRNEDFGELS